MKKVGRFRMTVCSGSYAAPLTNNKFLRFVSLIACSSIAADYYLNLFGKGRITAFKDNNQQMQINFERLGN